MPQIDFYILQSDKTQDRLTYAARLCEKATHHGLQVFVITDQTTTSIMDDTLWLFRPDAFVSHEVFNINNPQPLRAQVIISEALSSPEGLTPSNALLINLTQDMTEQHTEFARVAEVVTQDENTLKATRQRYISYKNAGYSLKTHTIA